MSATGNDGGREPSEVDRLDREIRELWPDGIPESQTLLWARLPIARRRKAVQRLRAVLDLDPPSGDRPVHATMEDAAKAAGTATSTFYPIARRWKLEHSLAALGVHATSDGPGIRMDEAARDDLELRIRALLDEEPDLTVGEIRARLADSLADPAFATVRRAVQRVVRDLPPRHPFGGGIVFDSAGLDVNHTPSAVLRLCTMLDSGTGLFLGWDIEPENEMLEAYGIAARRACLQSPRDRALRLHEGMSTFDMANARTSEDGPKFTVIVLPGMLASAREKLVEGPGVRIFESAKIGSAIVGAIGERIGPVWIGAGMREPGRSFRTGRIDPMPAFGSGLENLINQRIGEYNLHRLSLLQRDGGPDDAVRRAAEIGRRAKGLFRSLRPSA